MPPVLIIWALFCVHALLCHKHMHACPNHMDSTPLSKTPVLAQIWAVWSIHN